MIGSSRLKKSALLGLPLLLLAPLLSSGTALGADSKPQLVALIESTEGLKVVEFSVESKAAGEEKIKDLQARSEVLAVNWSNTYEQLSVEPGDGESPDEPGSEAFSVDDPLRSQQWSLDALKAEEAWTVASASPLSAAQGVTVAVIDGGVDVNAPDFVNSDGTSVLLEGYNAFTGTSTLDPDPHGTHVAGTIAAAVNNATGVSGLAPGAKILPVDVFDNGAATEASVARGIIWAVDNNADVINLSLGGVKSPYLGLGLDQDVLVSAIEYATQAGTVVVAAAGNMAQDGNILSYPAAYPVVVSVAAVDQNLDHAAFSQYNAYVDLAAPGVCIISLGGAEDAQACGASPEGYATIDGTSMAAPHVSAVAALAKSYWERQGVSLTGQALVYHLRATATDLGETGRDNFFGDGFVNPLQALETLPITQSPNAPVVSVPGDKTTSATDKDQLQGHEYWYSIVNYADEVSVEFEGTNYPYAEIADPDVTGQEALQAHCFPLSGARFLVGTTEVYCSAVSAEGEVGYSTFNVTVSGPGNSTAVPTPLTQAAEPVTVPVPTVVHAG